MGVEDFWDARYRVDEASSVAEEGPVLAAALTHFGDLAGKTVLDLGCGMGRSSLFFAQCGARVIAVDVSRVAVARLERLCAERGIANVEAVHGSAFEIDRLGPVDYAFGAMILHHLEPFDEFARVLRAAVAPGGRAFFYENSAMSRLLVWFREHVVGRAWVPKEGDDEEFPLTPGEVDLLRRQFSVRVEYPELLFFRLVSDYLLRGRLQAPFAWADRMGHRIPALRRLSYRQYLYLG